MLSTGGIPREYFAWSLRLLKILKFCVLWISSIGKCGRLSWQNGKKKNTTKEIPKKAEKKENRIKTRLEKSHRRRKQMLGKKKNLHELGMCSS